MNDYHQPTDGEILQRAIEADQLLQHPLIREAFDGLEQGAVARLASADTNDPGLLRTLTQSLQTVRAVRRRFEVWVAEGEAAAQRMQDEEERPSLLARFHNRFRRAA